MAEYLNDCRRHSANKIETQINALNAKMKVAEMNNQMREQTYMRVHNKNLLRIKVLEEEKGKKDAYWLERIRVHQLNQRDETPGNPEGGPLG